MKQEHPVISLVMVSGLLFLFHQYLHNETDINITFLNNYLDPFVLMPLLLYAVLWERRIVLKNKNMVLSYTDIFGYFILMVILGEVLFPFASEKFTADYWDILAYALGTLAYIIAKEISSFKKTKIKAFISVMF
jgi:hypothetical protein